MRDTRLIFVEGLPGAGKSTVAHHVASRLDEAGLAMRLLPEVQPDHPLNVGGALHPAGDTTGAELFRQYTVESYLAESLRRWQSFVAQAAGDDRSTVTVLDSYPYQNAARILLQMDAPLQVIQRYVRDVEATAQPLAPVLLYICRGLTTADLAETLRIRGSAWTAYAIEVITSCPYAEHRQLSGRDGALTMLGAYNALLEKLLVKSRLPHLVLDDCAAGWEACYARIAAFLSF